MEPCVISYFPGAGANRLARWFAGNDWQGNPDGHAHLVPFTPGFINDTHFDYVFPRKDSPPIPATTHIIAFTHCLNSDLVRQQYPGRKLIKIRGDFWTCLGRAWHVQVRDAAWFSVLQKRLMPPSQAINKFLNWNIDYYQETGVDWDCDELYDLQHSDHEVFVYMREMLKTQQDPEYMKFMSVYRRTRANLLEF
jgi:hypothetical protein